MVGADLVRIEAEGGAIFSNGAIPVLFGPEGDAETLVGEDVVRVEAEGGAIFGDGTVPVLFVLQGDSESVVGKDIVRIEAEGGPELANGPVPISFGREREPEIIVGSDLVRIEAESSPVFNNGAVQVPFLLQTESLIEMQYGIVDGFPMRSRGAGHGCHAEYQEDSPDPGSQACNQGGQDYSIVTVPVILVAFSVGALSIRTV